MSGDAAAGAASASVAMIVTVNLLMDGRAYIRPGPSVSPAMMRA